MKNYRSAFSMIELIFVIAIIGILGVFLAPKMGSMRETANLASAKSDIAAIRSAIFTERQSSLVRGTATFITKLTPGAASTTLFTGDGGVGGEPARVLLSYGLKKGTAAGEWKRVDDTSYTFHAGSQTTDFTYFPATGLFTCVADTQDCNLLTD